MSDAVIARTYGTTVDTQSVDGSYFTAAAVSEFGQEVDLALSKTSTVTVQGCGGLQFTMNTSEALTLTIVKSATDVKIHFDLSTVLDVDIYKNGVPTHFNAGVAISGDITAKYTQSSSCDCPSGKITISTCNFDLSAVTTLYFSDVGSSGTGALILDHNKVTVFSSFIASDGDSSADAAATFSGVAAMMSIFNSETSASDPFKGFTPYDYLMLKVLGGSAAAISADPSTTTALNSTLAATYTGALLAIDYATRALEVADTAPTDLALAASSDSGVKGDRITNDRTVTIDGKAGACDTVTLYDGTRCVGTASVNAAGVFHVTSSSLADGVHTLTVVSTAPDGVRVASDPFVVTIDGTSPNAPVVSSLSASGLAGKAEAGSQVAIYDNKVLVGTTTAAADGHWVLARALTDTTNHSYTLVATDTAGNTASSAGSALISQGASPSLTGGTGADVLLARPGAVLTGGSGHDLFIFDTLSGKATIADFTHGIDVIQVDHSYAADFAAVFAHAKWVNGDVVIDFDTTHLHTLTLKGVTLSTLSASDFVFG